MPRRLEKEDSTHEVKLETFCMLVAVRKGTTFAALAPARNDACDRALLP